MFKKCLGYSLIGMMLSNMSVGLVRFAIVGGAIQTGQVYAETIQSNTPLLDEIKRKYDLNNPNRNGKKDGIYPGMESQMNLPPVDRTAELQKQFNNQTPSRKIDLTQKGTTKTQAQMMNEGAVVGQSIGNKVGRPVLNQNGGIKAEYSRTGTREFYRDETTGELKSRAVEGVERVSNLGAEDMLSSEKDNAQYNFKADSMHGKDTELKQEGFRNHQQLKSGSTGAARGYQAIAGGAQRSLNTPINENEGWLQPGFNSLLETQKNTGEFFKSCDAVTVKKKQDIQYSSTTDFTCMDTGQANFDRCEVERKIRVPIYAENAGLKSCGPGCYEADMNISVWKSSKCRSTPANANSAVLDLFLNFDDGVKVQSVTLEGDADDHFRIKVNNTVALESPGGGMDGGACNPDGGHTINADITSQFMNAVGEQTGVKPVRVQGDIRWKRQGGFRVKFKIQLIDTTGKDFVSEFIQTPAGCYDALRPLDKRNKGLVGVYDWKEIGVNYSKGGDNYDCTSPSRTPTCNAGETLFGNVTQEQCLAEPVHIPPSCEVGTYDEVQKACYHPATLQTKVQPTDPDVYACPTAGTLEGNQCKTAAKITPPCQPGRNLKMVTVKGVEKEYCSGAPVGLTDHSWSCAGAGFEAGRCSVSLEDFRNSDGTLIKTVTDDGYEINPVFDTDGERAEFTDHANCTAPSTDTFKPKPVPESFCHFDQYQQIEVGDRGFHQSILDKIPAWYTGDTGNKTWKVNLQGYKCDPTEGRIMCKQNPDTGEEECTKWEHFQELTPRCDPYIQDNQCREISRKCPDGWYEKITGRCMSDIVTFRCDRGKTTTFETTETTNVCASAIPCAGGDCMNTPDESNDKFVEATLAANILNATQTDAKCENPSDPATCRVFNGEFKYCSWETSGLGTDCCEQPKGLDILSFISAAYQMSKLTQMAETGQFGSTAKGAYDTISQPVSDAATAVKNWFSGPASTTTENLVGNAAGQVASEGGTTALGATVESIKAAMYQLQQQVYGYVYNMLPESLAKLLFTTAGEQGATTYALDGVLTEYVGGIMMVYTVYNLTKLALTLLTACDDVEMDMGVRLAQRSCFKVGDSYCSKKYPVVGVCMQQRQEYCCFGSILSRIIMKESYDQLSINPMTGVPETSCQGLTAEQLGQVDFSKPSMKSALQEWVGLIAEAGLMRSTADEASLTGGAVSAEQSCQEVEVPVIDPQTGAQVRDDKGAVLYQKTGEKECFKHVTGGQIFNAAERDPVGTRTKEALGTADDRTQEMKDKMKDRANNLDCSVYPRPPACDMGFDVREAGGK